MFPETPDYQLVMAEIERFFFIRNRGPSHSFLGVHTLKQALSINHWARSGMGCRTFLFLEGGFGSQLIRLFVFHLLG